MSLDILQCHSINNISVTLLLPPLSPTAYIITGRLPWQPDGIKFTQCVIGQKSAFSPLQEKLCVGSKQEVHMMLTTGSTRVVSEIFNVEKCRDLEIGVRGHSRSLKVVPFGTSCMVSY